MYPSLVWYGMVCMVLDIAFELGLFSGPCWFGLVCLVEDCVRIIALVHCGFTVALVAFWTAWNGVADS